ncbi:hypothetical protein SHIRM173S_10530 [Streptomyces hirsutus]
MPRWLPRAMLLALALIALFQLGSWAFHELTGLLINILIAFFLALAIEPAVSWMAARGVRRGLGTFLVFLGVLIATAGFVTLLGSMLAGSRSSRSVEPPFKQCLEFVIICGQHALPARERRPDRHRAWSTASLRKAGCLVHLRGQTSAGQGNGRTPRNFLKGNPDLANEIEMTILKKLGIGVAGRGAGRLSSAADAVGAAAPADAAATPAPAAKTTKSKAAAVKS